ncbi:MAG: hypothetical protein ACI857_001522, partial [Arenicella sp.]
MKYLLTLLSFTLLPSLFAANRFWISATASNWNNTANWSLTSGGTGGASVPAITDVAIFNVNGLGNCSVDIVATVIGMTVNGYTGVIDLNGNGITSTGANVFTSGTINDVPATSALTINSTLTTTFNGTTFGAIINCTSARIYLSGSTFNNTLTVVKTGAGSDAGTGGNTFNGTTNISSTAVNYLMTANVNPDIFNGTLNVSNTGTNYIYLSHNAAGNQYNGNVNFESTGTSLGIRTCQGAAATATMAAGQTFGTFGGGYTVGDLRIWRT